MATPIGTNSVTALSRRHLLDQIVDAIYKSNTLLFRLIAGNKKMVQGGFQIELPIMWSQTQAGGFYAGPDVLDISPTDPFKNAAWDWRQCYVPITIDNLTLARSDHPDAVANLLTGLFDQAEMQMADFLGSGSWSDAVTNVKSIDGLRGAVDNGTVAATYGGLARGANPFWSAQVDAATTTLTTLAMRTLMGNATEGGRAPTVIFTTQFIYNRYWNLLQPNQAWPVNPGGADVQLAQAGFTNAVFDGVPVIVDSHVPANHLFFLNERYLELIVKTGLDFYLEDFVKPPNQDVFVSLLKWMGQLIVKNPARQGKMTAITA